MNQCVVPSWNLEHKIRHDLSQGVERNRSSHVDLDSHLLFHQNFSQIVPMSNYEVTELTWENGQPAMHELGGMFPPPHPPPTSSSSPPPKPTWGGIPRAGDTLESIVHQATYCNQQGPKTMPSAQDMKRVESHVGSSGGKRAENSVPIQNPTPPPPPPGMVKKWAHSECSHSRLPNDRESVCASANAAFSRDNNDTTLMTWASFESPKSCTRTKITTDEDSACHGGSENHEEEREVKGEAGRAHTARKGRVAAVHNQSERRRRDRINQKMKALQKLVPNASKTDKASMLDEVIEYLKQLQAQVQMMSTARLMPQIMMPTLGIQQHLQQMSLLARMGMGMGIGMLDPTSIGHTQTPHTIPQLVHPTQVATATATSPFVPPGAFVVPQMIPHQTQQTHPNPGASSSASLQDPYAMLLAQTMNMDLYNRMAALQRQQQQTPSQPTSNQLQNHHAQRGGGN